MAMCLYISRDVCASLDDCVGATMAVWARAERVTVSTPHLLGFHTHCMSEVFHLGRRCVHPIVLLDVQLQFSESSLGL
jgi:hypothetical protein